jgi:tetratricopeptide (TPR) repeat protein
VLFALTFAFLGVGSGQGGLDQLFSGVFGGGSSGPSISKSLKATLERPNDAQAWKDLATAYESKGRTDDAVFAWSHYTTLKPKNIEGLQSLAQAQGDQANKELANVIDIQNRLFAYQQSAYQPFAPSGKLGIGTGGIQQELQSLATQENQAFQTAIATTTSGYSGSIATYQKIAKLRPKSADAQGAVANAALGAYQQMRDPAFLTPAIKAYKRVIELDPTRAPELKATIKQLEKLQKQASG